MLCILCYVIMLCKLCYVIMLCIYIMLYYHVYILCVNETNFLIWRTNKDELMNLMLDEHFR